MGTACEIRGSKPLRDFGWEYGSGAECVRAIDYRIALLCTENFNYEKPVGEQFVEQPGIEIDEVGKMDVLQCKLMVDDKAGNRILTEDIETFQAAALKGSENVRTSRASVRTSPSVPWAHRRSTRASSSAARPAWKRGS